MTLIGQDTRKLLQDMHMLLTTEEALGKEGQFFVADWAKLRKRTEKALIVNGIDIPKPTKNPPLEAEPND